MRPTPRAVVAVLLALGSSVLVARGQQSVFRADVDHVSLDVVVTDKDERPVVGLTPGDFTVRDADRVQTIDDFKYVSIPPRPEPVDLAVPPLPPRDVATNALVRDQSRALVFVVNESSLDPADIVKTKRILAKLIEGVGPDDEAALIYVFHSDLSQDFTNDVGRLVAAANNLRAAVGLTFKSNGALLASFETARAVLDSATQPRKLIVYVGERSPGMTPVWIDACEKLRRAGVPIYPIDPVALAVYMPPEASVVRNTPGLVRSHYGMPPGFDVLAQFSGGHVFLHAGDPVASAGEIMAENGSYYLVGYYPTPFVRDGKFHPVTVSVRRPGLHVRALEGYWALDQATRDAAHTLSAALGAGLDNPDPPVALFAAPVTPTAKGASTVITTTVTYPESPAGSFDDQLHVGLVALDADAGIKARRDFTVPVHRAATNAGPFTVTMDELLDLPAGALTIRAAVTSAVVHATGSAHLKVEVPNLNQDGPELAGLVVGLAATRVEPVWGADMARQSVPFQPLTSRTFATTDQVRIFSQAYWKPSGSADAEAVVRILDSETSRTEPLTGHPAGPDRLGATVDVTVPLAGLSAGTHVLEVEVRRPGRPVAVRSIVFEIQ